MRVEIKRNGEEYIATLYRVHKDYQEFVRVAYGFTLATCMKALSVGIEIDEISFD